MLNISRFLSVGLLICVSCFAAIANSAEEGGFFAEPNPPFLEVESESGVESYDIIKERSAAPTTEWTFHKTFDGTHPDGNEQQIVWLMNRARANPTQEGVWLATSGDPEVAGGRTYFGVDLNKLKSEFAAISAKGPAAFDNRLYAAALAHSIDLIARDAQDHNNQFVRVDTAGFHYSSSTGYAIRGNVFSYATSGLNAHAAWNIDWGSTSDGMQAGRGCYVY